MKQGQELELTAVKRRERITELLHEQEEVSVRELAEKFEV